MHISSITSIRYYSKNTYENGKIIKNKYITGAKLALTGMREK